MDETLEQLFKRLWDGIAAAAQSATDDQPWHRLSLATVDAQGAPRSRLLILREVDPTRFTLRFHTDVRSAKWQEIATRPKVALLGYDPQAREQLRLAGEAARFGPGTAVQAATWQQLSAWSRTTYCGGPPGHRISQPPEAYHGAAPPPPLQTAHGEERFGVIDVTVRELEWYAHPRGAVRRAVFSCIPGEVGPGEWRAP